MSPFLAVYFVKHNMRRMAVVFAMIGLTALLYVGGSYLSNIAVENKAETSLMKNYAYVFDRGDDTDGSERERFLKAMEESSEYHVMTVGSNSFLYPTMLGFQNGDTAFGYTVEDFLWVNAREKWVSDTDRIADNTLIVSKREAEYLGLSDGGLFTKNREEATFYWGERPYRVVVSDTLEEFFCCLVAEDCAQNQLYLLTFGEASDVEKFQKDVEALKLRFPDLHFNTHQDRMENLNKAFAINRVIFISIIVVVSCVFFITINAVLVGIYEKRKNEFILYHCIGIPKRAAYQKVTAELVLITAVGMGIGIVLAFLAIFLFNAFVYRGTGLRMYYFHPWSICSFLICNACVLFPSILLRCRMVKKIGKEALEI